MSTTPETAVPPSDARLAEKLRIIEIYRSIQGESTWAGLPCTFVRFARCNLRCRWCDTTYSFTGGEDMPLVQILSEIRALGVSLVEITGGEPLAQGNCPVLCEALLERGHTVLIETGGSLPVDVLPADVIKIMDLKCPDSGECESNFWPNLEVLNPLQDEIKLVIASRRDYEWARAVIRERRLRDRCRAILLSPVFGEIAPKQIVEWMLEDHLPARFQLQLHKFIWPPEQKGV